MSYEIQPDIYCENCIKCGKRPVIEQTKKGWEIKCADRSCKNSISGPFVDFKNWDRLNKKNIAIETKQTTLKRTA